MGYGGMVLRPRVEVVWGYGGMVKHAGIAADEETEDFAGGLRHLSKHVSGSSRGHQ